MQITPVGERVLLKPIKGEERTKSGLYLPESSETKKEGEVLGVGVHEDGKPIALPVGTHVLYGGYSHDEFELNDEKYVIVEYKDIVAILKR